MQNFDADTTRNALAFDRLVAALAESFSKGCESPPRHVHEVLNPVVEDVGDIQARKMTSLIMPAWLPGRYYGLKVVNIASGNARLGLPGLHGSYLLFDARTGVPLAHIDGDEITARRTAAASALASKFLAREDARHLLVVGSGRVAGLLPSAYSVVRKIETVTVWARRSEAAESLAAAFRAQGFHAQATPSLSDACSHADIVSCATMSTEPLIKGAWLKKGSHLDLIGGFTPAMRESDDACFEQARVFVDTDEALKKSGDLIGPLNHGVFKVDDVRGTLTTLCKGVASGRRTAHERTVFKSVGTALEDLAAAILVYESANGCAVPA